MRRSRQSSARLLLSAAAVLGLHGALLWFATRAPATITGSAPALQVRTIAAPAEPRLAATAEPAAAPEPAEPPKPAKAEEPAYLQAQNLSVAPAADDPGLRIAYPDAALPGGGVHSFAGLLINAQGQVIEVRVEPDTLPEKFANAVRLAFTGQPFSPGRLEQRTVQALLCLALEFKEGEEPSWQVLDRAPASALACR